MLSHDVWLSVLLLLLGLYRKVASDVTSFDNYLRSTIHHLYPQVYFAGRCRVWHFVQFRNVEILVYKHLRILQAIPASIILCNVEFIVTETKEVTGFRIKLARVEFIGYISLTTLYRMSLVFSYISCMCIDVIDDAPCIIIGVYKLDIYRNVFWYMRLSLPFPQQRVNKLFVNFWFVNYLNWNENFLRSLNYSYTDDKFVMMYK